MSRLIDLENVLTFTEWHAAVLGAVIGAFSAYLHTIRFSAVGVFIGAVFVASALGIRVYDGSAAHRTVTKEPWYALAAFAVAGAGVLITL